MNKKHYLIPAVCGFICVALTVIVWCVYAGTVNLIASGLENNEGIGIALITAVFGVPLIIGDGIFAAVAAGLSIAALILMKRLKTNAALLKALGAFEILLALTFGFMFVLVLDVPVWAVMFGVALAAGVSSAVISFICAKKLKSSDV